MKHALTGAIKFNPVYVTTVEELLPFAENEETSAIMLWDLQEEIDVIDSVDLKVLAYM